MKHYLVIVQRCAFAPVLRGCAHKCDIVMTRDTVLLPPVQLHHVLAAHLHQPVHQTQGHEPVKHTRGLNAKEHDCSHILADSVMHRGRPFSSYSHSLYPLSQINTHTSVAPLRSVH